MYGYKREKVTSYFNKITYNIQKKDNKESKKEINKLIK